MGIVFGYTGVKEPSYKLIKSFSNFEVRRYPKICCAQVTTGDDNNGFRILAKYIGVYGTPENSRQMTLNMTAPVITKSEPQQLAMTAPVIMNGGVMSFVMPFEYDMSTLPKPTDDRITIREVPEKLVAVKTFSGWYNKEKGLEQRDSLVSDLVEEHLLSNEGSDAAKKDFSVSQYNPPFTLGFLRRNEIWIDIDESLPSVQELLNTQGES
eukprot:GSChrysophyteH1.ASY1.ANO1.900.1 assembled CDS